MLQLQYVTGSVKFTKLDVHCIETLVYATEAQKRFEKIEKKMRWYVITLLTLDTAEV